MGGYANLLFTLGLAIKFIGSKGSFFAENSFYILCGMLQINIGILFGVCWWEGKQKFIVSNRGQTACGIM